MNGEEYDIILVTLPTIHPTVTAVLILFPEPVDTLQETADSDTQIVLSQTDIPTVCAGESDIPPKFDPTIVRLAEVVAFTGKTVMFVTF